MKTAAIVLLVSFVLGITASVPHVVLFTDTGDVCLGSVNVCAKDASAGSSAGTPFLHEPTAAAQLPRNFLSAFAFPSVLFEFLLVVLNEHPPQV